MAEEHKDTGGKLSFASRLLGMLTIPYPSDKQLSNSSVDNPIVLSNYAYIAADTMIDAWHKDALSPEHAEQITGRYNALKKYVQDMSVSMQVSQPRLLLQVAVGDMKDNNSAFNSREFTNYLR